MIKVTVTQDDQISLLQINSHQCCVLQEEITLSRIKQDLSTPMLYKIGESMFCSCISSRIIIRENGYLHFNFLLPFLTT